MTLVERVLTVLLVGGLLAACSGGDESDAEGPDPDGSTTTTAGDADPAGVQRCDTTSPFCHVDAESLPFQVVLEQGMSGLGIATLELTSVEDNVVGLVGVEPDGDRLPAEVGAGGTVWLHNLVVGNVAVSADESVDLSLERTPRDNVGVGGPTPPPADPVFDPSSRSPACNGTYPYDPAAPVYAGPGPHPLGLERVLLPGDGPDTYRIQDNGLGGSLGPWLSATDPDSDGIYTGAQLLLCYQVATDAAAAPVGACEYPETDTQDFARLDVVPATYVFAVYEAKTGAFVETFTIPGTATPADSCPELIVFTDQTQIAQGVDTTALVDRLRPRIEAPA